MQVARNHPDWTELSPGIPPTGLKYQLNGGMEVEYGTRMRPGDVITGVTRLVGYFEREGRLGLILFTAGLSVMSARSAPSPRAGR